MSRPLIPAAASRAPADPAPKATGRGVPHACVPDAVANRLAARCSTAMTGHQWSADNVRAAREVLSGPDTEDLIAWMTDRLSRHLGTCPGWAVLALPAEMNDEDLQRAAAGMLAALGRPFFSIPGASWLWIGQESSTARNGSSFGGIGGQLLHIDAPNVEQVPDYTSLLLLRPDPAGGGASLVGDLHAAMAAMSEKDRALLAREVFFEGRAEGLCGVGAPRMPFHILDTTRDGRPWIRWAGKMLEDPRNDGDAVPVLRRFADALASCAHAVMLERGQLLIADQQRVAHGRTALGNQTGLPDGSRRLLLQAKATVEPVAPAQNGSGEAAVREQCDVIVVGVGVVGLAVALELMDRDLTVAIVGHRAGEHAGQASRASGAMLSTFSEIEPHHTAERVTTDTAERLAAHDSYPAWLERLRTAGTGLAAPAGTWVLAAASRAGSLATIASAARAAGHAAEQHPPGEIPGLDAPAESAAALWLPTERWIDSALLMAALADTVATHPRARWHDTTAATVDPHQRRVRCTDGTTLTGGEVVLAAGTAIPDMLPKNGRPWRIPPILAGRGVSLLLDAATITVPHVVRTPNAAFACGVHMVPRATGTVYLGGTNRLTTSPDPDRRASVDELAALTSEAITTLDHRIGAAGVLSARVGLRPYCPDHRPLIGRTTEPHLLLATATYRCGVLLAPHLAALLAQEITEPGSLNTHPYHAQRAMPAPGIGPLLAEGAAAGAVEHLMQGGGRLTPRAARELTAFITVALRAILGSDHPSLAAQRRLWQAAPVVEAIPSLLALAERTEPR